MVSAALLSVVAAVFAAPASLRLGDQTLAAASCARRETLGLSHYIATLYVRPGDSAPLALLDPNRAKALEIGILSKAFMPPEIPRKYRRALDAELDDDDMDRLREAYRALRPGDLIRIAYVPGAGLNLSVNGQRIIATPEHRVVETLLVTWAGDKPLDQHLRATLAKHPCPTPLTG
jgi:hypothetical protein